MHRAAFGLCVVMAVGCGGRGLLPRVSVGGGLLRTRDWDGSADRLRWERFVAVAASWPLPGPAAAPPAIIVDVACDGPSEDLCAWRDDAAVRFLNEEAP